MIKVVSVTSLCAGMVLWSTTSLAQLIDANGVDLLEAPAVYTLTNLHPDDERGVLYAVNYQQAGLIPRCSRVDLTRLKRKSLTFTVLDRGKEYVYENHEAAAEPFPDHLLHWFGTECDPADVEKLSELDQEGVRTGKVSVGMSRQGVIYAIGYPPRHVNPNLEASEWTYWWNRFNRFIIRFDGDTVESIVE